MIFLAARIHDKSRLRATSSIVVMVSVSIRAVVFIVTGLLAHTQILVFAALLVPAMLAGYFLGNRAHHALSRRRVIRLIAFLSPTARCSWYVRLRCWGAQERAAGGNAVPAEPARRPIICRGPQACPGQAIMVNRILPVTRQRTYRPKR
jgi:hypothetical protein